MINLRSIYEAAEERTRFAVVGLVLLVVAGVAGIVFFSATMTLALLGALVVVFVAFVRPTWVLLAFMWYLPFEPFLLKWVPDDVYVYARYASELLVYVLVAVVLWRLVSGAASWRKSPVDVFALLFLFILLISSLVNFSTGTVMVLGIRQIIRFVLLYFVTVQLAPGKRFARVLLGGLVAIVAVQIALGAGQAVIGERLDTFLLPSERRTIGEIQLTAGQVQFWDPGQRVFGTLGRYDQLGTFMAFVMLLMAAAMYEWKDKLAVKKMWWVFLPALPILALTYSRSAWFGFVLGFLFLAVFAKRDRRVFIGVGAFVVAVVMYLSVSGLVVRQLVDVSGQSVSDRFFEAFSAERWAGEYYGLGRSYWMVQTLTTVVPSSPLLGHGPANYGGGAVAALHNTRTYDTLGLPFGVYGTDGYIDNNWFSVWGETGTLGLGAYLAIYITLFLLCIRVWRESTDPEVRALAIGTACAMIAVALNAFLATYLEARTLAPYLWVFAGLVTVAADEKKYENPSR